MQPLFKIPDVVPLPLMPELESYLRRFKEAVEDGGRRIAAIEIVDGQRLKSVSIPATTNTAIPHKLGRRIQGYIATNASTGANIRRTTVAGEDTSKQFTLYASAAVVVDIWVF